MPDQSDIFDVNRKHLTGRLLTSTVSRGAIAGISLPNDSEFRDILVLKATDFESNGSVKIMGESLPFFAGEEISYKGQPIMAVFGHEAEEVEFFCKDVNISYHIDQDSEDYDGQQYGEAQSWSYGNTDEYFTDDAKVFESVFDVDPFSNTMLGDQKVFAIQKGGKLNIRVATQWPTHLRKTVADNLGCDLGDIVIHPLPYYAPYDQLIVTPSAMATIAALAAIQSGELVQLTCPMTSWQPRMTIRHTTAFMPDGTILADRAVCNVDLGAFPLFSEEICNSILAGLVPPYPMKAVQASISVTRSSTPPANFFGDLGFAMAFAGTEQHFNRLAHSIGMQPGKWRLEILSEIGPNGLVHTQSIRKSLNEDKISASLQSVMDLSWYTRKYASNSQSRMAGIRMNPNINYSRGIGVACGEGMIGFSQCYNAASKYALSVTLDQEGNLLVNTGMLASRSMTANWKNTIRKTMDIPEEKIHFLDINAPDILEIGPNVLSRKVGIVATLLDKACSELARKKEFSRIPLKVTAEYEAEATDPLFFSSSIGSVAIDLHIDTLLLSPIIDNVWVTFHLGPVFDKDKLLNRARHTITSVLSDICPRSSAKCNVRIDLVQDADFSVSSITSLLRGLTTAALIGALSQALGHQIHKIPVTSDDILAIARKTPSSSETIMQSEGDEK